MHGDMSFGLRLGAFGFSALQMPSASIRTGPRETEAADFAVESIIAHFPKKHKELQSGRFAFALQQRSEQGSKTGLDPVSEYMRDLRLDKQFATDEVVADYAMRVLFSDMKTAREVTKHHSKVAEAIRRAFAWIREKLGIQTSEVDRATAMWNKAYNESRRNANAAVADAVNRAKGVANSIETGYNSIKNSIAQNNAKLIRYFTGEVRESGDVYLSDRDKTKIAHNVKSGNGWMHKDGKHGWVYTDVCFYMFDFSKDHSITVTHEFFIEDDAETIERIRRGNRSHGNTANSGRNDLQSRSKEFRSGVSAEYYVSGDARRRSDGVFEVHGQESGGGRVRSDRRSGQNHEKSFASSEKQNKVKADSVESAFFVGKVKDSASLSDYACFAHTRDCARRHKRKIQADRLGFFMAENRNFNRISKGGAFSAQRGCSSFRNAPLRRKCDTISYSIFFIIVVAVFSPERPSLGVLPNVTI